MVAIIIQPPRLDETVPDLFSSRTVAWADRSLSVAWSTSASSLRDSLLCLSIVIHAVRGTAAPPLKRAVRTARAVVRSRLAVPGLSPRGGIGVWSSFGWQR